MKVIAAVVLVLLFLAPPVISQVLDDKLIVPGQRIGNWTLEMTIQALTRANGQPALVSPPIWGDGLPGLVEHYWPAIGLRAGTFDGQSIAYIEVDPENTAYKTEKGIGWNSPSAAVTTAYGTPTAITTAGYGRSRWIYDSIGLSFIVLNFVRRAEIFKPGSARSIWKF